MFHNSRCNKISDQCSECDKKTNSFFCSLSSEELRDLSINKTYGEYAKGQIIFNEGKRPQALYCIYEGQVKLYKLGEGGKEQIIRLAGKGDIIGYRSLISHEKYSCTASTLKTAQICQVSINSFDSVIKRSSALNYKLLKLLSKDIKTTENKIVKISQKTVQERIAEVLFIMHQTFGTHEDGKTLQANLTRKEIGDMAGVTTETTVRKLSDFNRDGIIVIDSRKIIVPDPSQLLRIAQLYD